MMPATSEITLRDHYGDVTLARWLLSEDIRGVIMVSVRVSHACGVLCDPLEYAVARDLYVSDVVRKGLRSLLVIAGFECPDIDAIIDAIKPDATGNPAHVHDYRFVRPVDWCGAWERADQSKVRRLFKVE